MGRETGGCSRVKIKLLAGNLPYTKGPRTRQPSPTPQFRNTPLTCGLYPP